MSKISKQDYYFGAALSLLLRKNTDSCPSLLENTGSSRTYTLSTNTSEEFCIYMKYCGQEKSNDRKNETTWQFSFTETDKKRIRDRVARGERLYIFLICGTEDLSDGEVVVLTQNEYRVISHKSSIRVKYTPGRKKVEVADQKGCTLMVDKNRLDGIITEIEDCKECQKLLESSAETRAEAGLKKKNGK